MNGSNKQGKLDPAMKVIIFESAALEFTMARCYSPKFLGHRTPYPSLCQSKLEKRRI